MQRYVGIAIAIAFASGSAVAQTTFGEIDANRNSAISDEEFYDYMSDAGLFGNWDTDGDGLIEENEFTSIGLDDGVGDFNEWDTDNNDFVDAAEFYDGVYEGFDRDENGHWDEAEWDDAGDAGLFDV